MVNIGHQTSNINLKVREVLIPIFHPARQKILLYRSMKAIQNEMTQDAGVTRQVQDGMK